MKIYKVIGFPQDEYEAIEERLSVEARGRWEVATSWVHRIALTPQVVFLLARNTNELDEDYDLIKIGGVWRKVEKAKKVNTLKGE